MGSGLTFRNLSAGIVFVILVFTGCNSIDLNKRYEADLSGLDWKLWLDSTARWENDSLYLPPVISGLPFLQMHLPEVGIIF